jgi:hypothetical protein
MGSQSGDPLPSFRACVGSGRVVIGAVRGASHRSQVPGETLHIRPPRENPIERRPDFMRLFLMLALEAGIVTHLPKQDCGPDEQEHLKKTPEQERLDRQFSCGGSRRFRAKS